MEQLRTGRVLFVRLSWRGMLLASKVDPSRSLSVPVVLGVVGWQINSGGGDALPVQDEERMQLICRDGAKHTQRSGWEQDRFDGGTREGGKEMEKRDTRRRLLM
jgi:hypothetical protein